MRKNIISRLSSFSLISCLVAMLAFGSTSAAAATVDLGEVEFGKTYEFPDFSEVKGTLTAIADGTMSQVGCDDIALYEDAGLQKSVEFEHGFLAGGSTKKYQLKKGTKYYLYAGFTMSGKSVTFYMDGAVEQPLEAQFNVAPGSTLNFANYPVLNLYCSREASVDTENSLIAYTDAKTNAAATVKPRVTVNGTTINVYVYQALKPLLENGTILPGNPVSVKLKDVKSSTGTFIKGTDDNGYVTYNYYCGSIPTTSVGSKIPAQFLSFWPAGDQSGILSMTFGSELSLSDKTRAELVYGDVESELGAYVESVPVTISEDAKTIYADFTGKLRTPQIMTPSETGTVYQNMGVNLIGVVDKYGNPVQSEGQGTVGAYSWNIPYVLIERTPITAEFTPANGASLEGVDEISVYLSPLKTFSFTGFNFSYTDGSETKTVVVDKAAATVTNLASDGNSADYTFAIPAEVKGKKNVTVTLANLTSTDGYNHELDVKANYDSFVIVYSDPANGAEMAALSYGTEITVEPNCYDTYPELYMVYEIEDMNPTNPDQAIVKAESWFNRQDNGTYTATVYGNYKLIQGHEYHVNITAWASENDKNYREAPIGETFITWYGTTPAYVYSSIVLESITPSPETMLTAEDNVITLKFDGLVRLDNETTFINTGFGSTMSFESLTPIDPQDNEGTILSNTWELKISDSYLASLTAALDISFKAYDIDGRLVKGNLGEDEETYFYYTYEYAGAFASYDVAAVGEEPLTSVKEFTASSDRGITFSYYMPYNSAYVVDSKRAIVAYVNDVKAAENELGTKCTSQTLVLENEITESGRYVLVIPRNYFIIDEEFSSQNGMEMTYEFIIAGSENPDVCRVALSPEAGEVSSVPETIEMYFLDYPEIGLGSGSPTLTIDGGETIKLNDVELDWDILNMATLTLPQSYTEPGTYVINFPAGYFLLGADGKESPALSFEYIIKAAEQINVTADPAVGNVTVLPDVITLTFNDYSEVGGGMGRATLTIDGGEPITLPDAGYGTEMNQMDVYLNQAYEANGTYVLSFPAGYFSLGFDGAASPAFTLTYTIGGTTGISVITADADGLYRVYNAAGVKVLETSDFNEIHTLTSGLYIVNGSKLLVK